MRKCERRRFRGGYTLAEVLTVVALIAVLSTIAIPSVIRYRRDLKLTELDDSARTIFLAAQNHLTALCSAEGGTLELGGTTLRESVEAVPALADGTPLRRVSTNETGAEPDWLVLPGSVESGLTGAGSYYIVEFDPASGTVYGVFYTNQSEGAPLTRSVYEELCAFSSDGHSCRTRQGRNAFAASSGGFLVGYYGSDGAPDMERPDGRKLPKPKLKLINAEELALEFYGEAEAGLDTTKVFWSVSITGKDATGAESTKTLVDKGTFTSGEASANTVVLDTLKSDYSRFPGSAAYGGWTVGGRFTDWADGSIVPGADVTVTVTLWYQPDTGEGIAALPQSASRTTNSLFAARNGERVELGYGRHLQNLGLAGLDSGITTAVQARDIDFAQNTPEVNGDEREYWDETYGHDGLLFVPIDGGQNSLTEFDGGGFVMRGLNASVSDSRSGLFARLTRGTVKNVTLVDGVTGNADVSGTLAATAQKEGDDPIELENCKVYLTPSSDVSPRVRGARAGGLLGYADGVTVTDSFASTIVQGRSVGGLAGASNATLRRCYAAGRLSGTDVGGLVGDSRAGARYEDCYAAGTIVSATASAAGLTQGSGSARRCYAAVELFQAPEGGTVYGAISWSDDQSNCFYLVQPGLTYTRPDGADIAGVTAVRSTKAMRRDSQLSALGSAFQESGTGAEETTPYNFPGAEGPRDPQLTAPYPYPTLTGLDHYGDWLVADAAIYLAYFERYADGTYGLYYQGAGADGSVQTVDTLRGDATVADDGYAALAPDQPSLTDADGAAVTLTQVAGQSLTLEDRTYQLYTLDGTWLSGHHGYQQVSLGGQRLWLDPDFAKTVSDVAVTNATAGTFAVRTVRHLSNLDALADYAAKSFVQERSIDGATYEGTLYGKNQGDWKTFSVQFDAATPFTGAFTGGMAKSWPIRNLALSGEGDVGLFGVVDGGTVRDVKLENCAVSAWGDSTGAGSLVGRLRSGTVTNSGAYVVADNGLTRDAPYGNYGVTNSYGAGSFGGLVGRMEGGAVSYSFAAVRVNGATAGGLVGTLTGGAVSNSYVGGHMDYGAFQAWNANIYGSSASGGFAGSWIGGSVSGTCYTTASVGAPLEGKIGAFAGEYPAGTTLSESYARVQLFHGGNQVPEESWPDGGLFADAKAWKLTGDPAVAHPYDNTVPLAEEFDYKPIVCADGSLMPHYGDWPELKMLHGKVAYYEQFKQGDALVTQFAYYDRNVLDGSGKLVEQGTLDVTRSGSLYSDGYAFLSLKMLHDEWEWSPSVQLNVAIGAGAEMAPYTTTYLGSFREDLTPYVKDESNPYDKPTYYAYALPAAALDGAVAAEEYFLQLRVAGLEDEAELSSLWLNPHFGRAAYNGYGDTNPKDGTPRQDVPSATVGTIYIRSVRQFNNMRLYKAAIRSWAQQLDMDASQYKGHQATDSEGYVTLGGLRVMVQGSDGTWQPTWDANAVNGAYRLAMTPITMTSPSKGLTKDNWGGTYDGMGHLIGNLSIGEVTGVGSSDKDRYYAGLFCNLSSGSAVKNLTLTDCDVTGRSGSSNDFAGALAGYTQGTISNCTVINTSVTAKPEGSSAKGYTGGFVGYVRDGLVENCGVRVEGSNANSLYNTCAVSGAGEVGGFTGQQRGGTVQYCYAAVKVAGGKVAGGFMGTLDKSGSTVSNCYAAGHTSSGKYLSSVPNVSGTGSTGGFIGQWSGGTLSGLCYTTCSVSGGSGAADVFVGASSGKTAPAGCYAGGDVINAGATTNRLGVEVRPLAEEPASTQAAAHPYDKSLPAWYTHKPVVYPDGSLMPHYGDWYRKSSRSGREWVQNTTELAVNEYDNFQPTMEWEGDMLHMTFLITNNGEGNDLYNTGPFTNGVFAITTDLGYKLIFRATSDTHEIIGGSGATFTSTRTLLDADGNVLENDDHGHAYVLWDVQVSAADFPPYREKVMLGSLDDKFLAVIDAPAEGRVTRSSNDVVITVGDGTFEDWLGYEHQLVERLPGMEQTPLYGHTFGAALGDGNQIFLHMRTDDATVVETGLTNLSSTPLLGNIALTLTGEDGYTWTPDYTFSIYTAPYTGNQTYAITQTIWNSETGQNEVSTIGQIYVEYGETSQEYEMSLDLEAIAGAEQANKINAASFEFSRWGKTLTITRDLTDEAS